MHIVEPPSVTAATTIGHAHDPTILIDKEALKRVRPGVLFCVDWYVFVTSPNPLRFNLFNAHFLLPFFYVLNYVGWWNTLGYCNTL